MKEVILNSKKFFCFLFGITLLVSCNPNNDKSINANSVNKNSVQISQANHRNKSIIGIWGVEEQPSFEIKNDSIYYIDSDKSYKYSVSDSTITIFYEDFIYKGIFYTPNDKTLIIKDSLNTNTYQKSIEK